MTYDHKRRWSGRERTIYAMGLVNSRSRAHYEVEKLKKEIDELKRKLEQRG